MDREMQDFPVAWAWCREDAKAPAIGTFFAAHAEASYISHSELQFGRAVAPGRWSEDLRSKIVAEAALAIAAASDEAREATWCALAQRQDGGIAGLAFVRFSPGGPAPFAVLEDLLIDPAQRRAGLGRRLIAWLRPQCRARGCRSLFLESGRGNDAAHRFFERQGFVQTSIVMRRDL